MPVRVASPLRYPGGKAQMTSVLRQIRGLNHLNGCAVAEPFAGGAGASLSLLYQRETHEIHINDLDQAIHDFWWSAIHNSAALLAYLEESPVSIDEWERWRNVYRGTRTSRLRRGFAAFYLNRCNHSGIIENGSAIGGLDQGGRWKIDARFNKTTLRERLVRLAEEHDRIFVSGHDGIDFIDTLDPQSTMYFLDPPYCTKGPTLYMNSLDHDYHASLAKKLKSMSKAAWVLTYDDCPEIRTLYGGWAAIHPFSLRYSAADRRQGKEVLITPKWLRLPAVQDSAAITWRSPRSVFASE